MEITLPGIQGRVVAPAGVAPLPLSETLSIGQSLVGEVVRVFPQGGIAPQGGVLVNVQGQQILLEPGQPLAPGQTITLTVMQVVPTLMLQLTDNTAVQPSTALPALTAVPEGQESMVTASQFKAYLAARQPFGAIVTGLVDLLRHQPLLHALAPGLTQDLGDTLAVLQSQAALPPDAAQLKEQVDRSGLNYESKVRRALTGESALTATALAKDLKGQLLALSHRLEQYAHTGTAAQQQEAAAGLERITRAVQALELQQLANALREHQPLVLPLVNPFVSPPQTTQLTVQRDGGQAGHGAAEPERYTVALSLALSALGTVHIEASVQGATVSATLYVADPAVAALLRAAMPELTAGLQALGLRARVACELQERLAQECAPPLPRALTRAVTLVDITV